MRTTKVTAIALVGAFLLLSSGAINAQDIRYDDSAFQLKSPQKAQAISALSTFGPVATGALWWALDGPDAVRTYDTYGRSPGSYTKDPDRTGPITLIISGVMIGPSVGYFYGNATSRGVEGIAIRGGVAAASLIVGNEMGLEIDIFGTGEADDDGWLVVITGVAFVIGHAISDIASVKDHVRERNDELTYENRSSVTLTPKYFTGSGAAGLQLQVTF